MRAVRIIQRGFESELAVVHVGRIRLVFQAAFTLLKTARLSLTSLGRAIATGAHKHGIKRIDRLLGNVKLHAELVMFYRAIARRVVSPGTRPVVLVDWTAVTPGLWALVAAVVFDGRALVIHAETHPISRYLKPEVNEAFLLRVQQILPARCRPIIVTDAGFRSPWMRLVARFGWDYVGRVRAPAKVRRHNGYAWSEIEDVWRFARFIPSDLGLYETGRKKPYATRLVGIRKREGKMRRPATRDHGCARQLRNAREPWILATSLTCTAAKVIAIYRLRMQIEETFRDAKSPRFGLALHHARTSSEHRANVLLLLASLTQLMAVLLGLAAEATAEHLRFQANTTTSRRVLSRPPLGRLFATQATFANIRLAFSRTCWQRLRRTVLSCAA